MECEHAEILQTYTRDFSALPGLQAAHRVGYTLYAAGEGLCIEVCRSDAGPAVRCALRGLTPAFGRDLLQFLYENALPPRQAAEVVQDICGGLAV